MWLLVRVRPCHARWIPLVVHDTELDFPTYWTGLGVFSSKYPRIELGTAFRANNIHTHRLTSSTALSAARQMAKGAPPSIAKTDIWGSSDRPSFTSTFQNALIFWISPHTGQDHAITLKYKRRSNIFSTTSQAAEMEVE